MFVFGVLHRRGSAPRSRESSARSRHFREISSGKFHFVTLFLIQRERLLWIPVYFS
jgi:hypothetical protein